MCKAFIYRARCSTCGWVSPYELEKSEQQPGHELCSDAKNRRNPRRYGYMSCRHWPEPRPDLQEEEVTVHVAYHGNECKGRCADKEAEEAETFSAELYRQHMKDWNKVKMEVQKEDARKRRKIQKQYIADCVEAMKNAPKRAEAAHREQEEKLEGAREELRRIEEWQTWVEEEARWLEDKLQTMGAPQSLG